jgi:hypothetical protein
MVIRSLAEQNVLSSRLSFIEDNTGEYIAAALSATFKKFNIDRSAGFLVKT